jgi:hypothetical protein
VHEPLLQPLATPETVMLHPRRQLESLCLNQGWHLEVQSSQQDGIVQAHVFINRILLGSSQSKERNVARRLAAFKVPTCTLYITVFNTPKKHTIDTYHVL